MLVTGLAGVLSWQYWATPAKSVLSWLNRGLAVLSVVATLFLVYNILAGGNPAKSSTSENEGEAKKG